MDIGDIADLVTDLHATFDRGRTKPLAWRIAQLRALKSLLADNSGAFEDALKSDLGKNPTETNLVEVGFVIAEIDFALKHLRSWLKPRSVPVPAALQPARASIIREPLGVVLIIAPWNYPVQLLLAPAVGALAAGNAVVLKPSELAPATSQLIAELIPLYLDRSAVRVVEGAVPETTELLAQRFDHIFYTGNGQVGRIVMAAAVKHLTPVTLELGGKSPVYVDDSVDLAAAARRIAWGKFLNAGQTCVAPDYLMTTSAIAAKLAPLLLEAATEFYGADPASSADYGRIVNERQFDRLTTLVGSGTTVGGGEFDESELYFAPTVLTHVDLDSPVMQQEIFGPILPIVEVAGVDEAIGIINAGDKPLALYVYTEHESVRKRFMTQTSSGAIGFGVAAAHLVVPGLAFGGVGESGMGGYHGEHTMDVFSHDKAILRKSLKPDTMRLIYPPYTPRKDRFIRGILRLLG